MGPGYIRVRLGLLLGPFTKERKMKCPVEPPVVNALVVVLVIILLGLLVGGRLDLLRGAAQLLLEVRNGWSFSM